jgi:hypothetical protein
MRVLPATYATRIAKAIKQLADVAAVHGEIELGAVAARHLPLAGAGKLGHRVEQLDFIEPPSAAIVMCLHFEPPEAADADFEFVDHDIERWQCLQGIIGLDGLEPYARPCRAAAISSSAR